jgi:hypothetical protein
MLFSWVKWVDELSLEALPVVNVIQNPVCLFLSMFQDEIFFYPAYKVILEGPFDYLME